MLAQLMSVKKEPPVLRRDLRRRSTPEIRLRCAVAIVATGNAERAEEQPYLRLAATAAGPAPRRCGSRRRRSTGLRRA